MSARPTPGWLFEAIKNDKRNFRARPGGRREHQRQPADVRRDKPVAINGENLAEASCSVSWNLGEEVRTAAATISARGANLLVIDWPAEFSGIADGTEVTFTVTKTSDGKDYAVNATAVVVG